MDYVMSAAVHHHVVDQSRNRFDLICFFSSIMTQKNLHDEAEVIASYNCVQVIVMWWWTVVEEQ